MRGVLLGVALAAFLGAAPARAESPPPTRTATAPIDLDLGEAFVRARGDELLARGPEIERPLFARWWFWGLVGTLAAGVVTAGVVLSSGGTFEPEGELGTSRSSDWTRL